MGRSTARIDVGPLCDGIESEAGEGDDAHESQHGVVDFRASPQPLGILVGEIEVGEKNAAIVVRTPR